MKTYVVGGAVRDALLGLPVSDRDWVVVGATPEAMLSAGFKPVGKDFPVFLHPDTHEEYALARTERKTAPGYHGFTFHADPTTTLEEDLRRRDLTINAIARDETGHLIDPCGGQQDLAARVFRHVSPAFSEDPVRILRVARFAARFGDFTLAPETLALMQAMVEAGEVDHLVPERVWQEIARGLMYAAPARLFAVLAECGALGRILPELAPRLTPTTEAGLVRAAKADLLLAGRFGLLCADLPALEDVDALCARLKVPVECRDLARMVWREQRSVDLAMTPEAAIAFFDRCDAWRRPERLRELLACLQVLRADAPVVRLARQLAAAQAVDGGAIARATPDKSSLPLAIRAARTAAAAAI